MCASEQAPSSGKLWRLLISGLQASQSWICNKGQAYYFLSWAREKIINLFRGWDIKICNYSNAWLPFRLLHLIPWGYRKWIRSITSVSVSVKIINFFQLKLSINALRPVDDFCSACLCMTILSQIIANIIFNLKCPFHIFVLPSLWTFNFAVAFAILWKGPQTGTPIAPMSAKDFVT